MNDRAASSALNAQTAIAAIADPSPVLFLHCAIFLHGNRLLSDETFRLVSFQGQETASDLFEYQLELHGNTAGQGDTYNFNDLVGRPVTVGIQYPSDYSREQMEERFQRAIRGGGSGGDGTELSLFNGCIGSFSMENPGVYRIGMKPAAWKLSLTNAYVVHGQKNIRDAIGDLLDAHRIAYSMDAVSGDENPAIARIQDWLQAGETDLDFIRRLMGKAHLYYFFSHTGNSHKMVFANRKAYPQVFADRRPLRYTYSAADETGLAQADVISQYSYRRTLTSSSVQGVFAVQEAVWEEDPITAVQSFQAGSRTDPGELPFRQYRIYQYGCSTDEVQHYADTTGQTMETSASQFGGSSFCAHFRAGHQFTVSGERVPALDGQSFVLTQVKHQASADGGYSNEFQAADVDGLITAFSIQETQQGSLLATVVAKAGDTPPQNWRYYTPAYFDPETSAIVDTQGVKPKLNAMGVYVRFSTDPENAEPVWIKLGPSMQTVPEIGATVTIARAQDESELPEIQSITHSNGNMVVMPSGWTANSHVGSSYSVNYGDGKSIRYGRRSPIDLNAAIALVTAPYDSGDYRDTGYSQGAGYNYSCADSKAGSASDSGELYGPYAGAGDLLNASESFGSSYNRQYAQVSSSFSNIGTSYNKSIVGVSESHSLINGTSYSDTTHEGDITSKTTIHADSSNTTTQIGDTDNVTTNVGNISSVNTIVGINSSVASTLVSIGLDTTGASTRTSLTGVSNNNAMTGASASVNLTGIATTLNVTGVSNNVNVTAESSNESVTLSSNELSASVETSNMSVMADSTTISAKLASLDVSYIGSANSMSINDAFIRIDICGPGTICELKSTNVEVKMIGPDITLLSAIKLIM